MYTYETRFIEGRPQFVVLLPDNEIKTFKHEEDASNYCDWLNLIEG